MNASERNDRNLSEPRGGLGRAKLAVAAAAAVLSVGLMLGGLAVVGQGDGTGRDAPARRAAASDDPRAAIDLVAPEHRPIISPDLVDASAWPADAGLAPLVHLPAEARPSRRIAERLIQTVAAFVPEGAIDADPERAVCRDADGELYVRLQAPGAYGQARVEVAPDGSETVSFRWSFDDEIPLDEERLLWRLQSAGSDRLAEQLASERTDRGAHPTVNGEDAFQATYVLDPQGIGVVYPFAMAYATPRHAVVVYKGATANHVPPR